MLRGNKNINKMAVTYIFQGVVVAKSASYILSFAAISFLLSLIIGCRHHVQPLSHLQPLPYPVKISYDTIAFEKDYPATDKRQLLSTCHQQKLITVGADFAADVKAMGAGRLKDGNTVGVSWDCECGLGYHCFKFLDSEHQWGLTPRHTARHLYTSVSASSLPLGSVLYIPALDGMTIPNTQDQKHNGYVRVDSRNYFAHNQINLFVGTEDVAKKFAYLFKHEENVEICMTQECTERVLQF